jgi:hypothetical protein
MLLPLALLIVIIQTPIWIALIVFPNSAPSRALLQGAPPYQPNPKASGPFALLHKGIAIMTDWKFVLIGIGVLFVFVLIGTLAYTASYASTVANALSALPADSKAINAESVKPALDALKISGGVAGTVIAVLLASTVFDFMAGILAYREMMHAKLPRFQQSVTLLIMFLLGPISAIIFGLWLLLRGNPRTTGEQPNDS